MEYLCFHEWQDDSKDLALTPRAKTNFSGKQVNLAFLEKSLTPPHIQSSIKFAASGEN